MKIAVIGAGNVGSALGRAWAENGHEVYFGVRDPGEAQSSGLARAARAFAAYCRCLRAGDIIVLAVPWGGVRVVLDQCGPMNGKIVVDCINPLKPDYSGLEIGHTTSAGESVAQWAQVVRVVKAFNMTGAGNMSPHVQFPVKPVMFICGDDPAAKKAVLGLCRRWALMCGGMPGISRPRGCSNLWPCCGYIWPGARDMVSILRLPW